VVLGVSTAGTKLILRRDGGVQGRAVYSANEGRQSPLFHPRPNAPLLSASAEHHTEAARDLKELPGQRCAVDFDSAKRGVTNIEKILRLPAYSKWQIYKILA